MRILVASVLALVVGVPVVSSATAECAGDCNGDGRITVAELVRGVRCALSPTPLITCASCFPAPVSITSLVSAVGGAMYGCGAGGPPPTPTPVGVSTFTYTLVPYTQCSGNIPPEEPFDPTPFLDDLRSDGWTIVDFEVTTAEVTCTACGCPVSGSPILEVRVTR